MGKDFSEHQEIFSNIEGKAGGSVPETGVTLTIIGHMIGLRPLVILNRLDANPLEVIAIYALGYLKGIGDEDLFFMYMW